MPSHPFNTHTAPFTAGDLWERFIRSVVPLEEFRDAREEIVELYAEVYSEIDEVQESFSEMSNPELREWALQPYQIIPDYDPHEEVTELLSLPAKLLRWVKQISIVIAVLGSLLSANWLRTLGKNGLGLVDAIEAAIPLSIIAGCIFYLWLLYADTRAHQTFGEELRAGPAKVQTRRRSRIVGYGVWNRSLLGQSGLLLVSIFFLLAALPRLPITNRWFEDPVGYIGDLLTNNLRLLYNADSISGAYLQILLRLL